MPLISKIQLTNGGTTALVDEADLPLLAPYTWSQGGRGYALGNNKREKLVKMHRLIMDAPRGMDIDHINRNKLDNRRSNLRVVTRSQNMLNASLFSNNKTGAKGVGWYKQGRKWRAYVVVNYRQKHLGYFDDIKDAISARREFNIANGIPL